MNNSMRNIYQLLIFIILISYMGKASDNPSRIIRDNTPAKTASITFVADVVNLLKIDNETLVLNIGPLAVGETKILGSDYNAVFSLNGLPNAKFVINLVDNTYENEGVTLEGVNWEFRNSRDLDYTQIQSFPFVSQLSDQNGDAWIRVYPEKIKANKNILTKTVYFEFKFNCSYYDF